LIAEIESEWIGLVVLAIVICVSANISKPTFL